MRFEDQFGLFGSNLQIMRDLLGIRGSFEDEKFHKYEKQRKGGGVRNFSRAPGNSWAPDRAWAGLYFERGRGLGWERDGIFPGGLTSCRARGFGG